MQQVAGGDRARHSFRRINGAPPLVAFVTMRTWGPSYLRIGRWLGTGLREIGASADIVYLDGSPLASLNGSVHEIQLGVRGARWGLPKLARYVYEREPAMTLATPGVIGLLTLIAGEATNRAVVPWEASIPRLDARDVPLTVRPYYAVAGLAYRRAARVAAVSDGVRDAMAADLVPRGVKRKDLVIIPNPVDAGEVRRLARPVADRTNRLRFCSVGRLVSSKGFDVLVEAFALARLGRAWELLIIGEGPQRASLELLVRRHGLEDHVRFLGWVDNPWPLMASTDVAVMAGRWEGFGMAVAEAVALGLPQIATECPGGISATLGHGECGVLVPPEDPSSLAKALTRLADDAGLRRDLGEKALLRAEQYAPARVAQRVVELAHEIGHERVRTTGRCR